MTQRNNHLRNTHAPHAAARARAQVAALHERMLVAALAITALITVLVLITSPTSAEYGFV